MLKTLKSSLTKWKAAHGAFWQFIVFMLMSCITTVVDLGSFSLLNFWAFSHLKEQAFSWWLINYSVAAGGLCAFLSFALSFAVSQTFNFFLQRKATFKADNNLLFSGVMYAVMVIAVYFLQIYLPTLIRESIARLIGSTYGDLVVKFVNMTMSMLIQFPMNKYVIMRGKKH